MNKFFLIFFVLFCQTNAIARWGTYRPSTLFTLYDTKYHNYIQFGYTQQYEQIIYGIPSLAITNQSQSNNSQYNYHDGHSFFEKTIQTHNNCTIKIYGIINENDFELKFKIKNPLMNKFYFYFSNLTIENGYYENVVFSESSKCNYRSTVNMSIQQLIYKAQHKQLVQQNGVSKFIQCIPKYEDFQFIIRSNDYITKQDQFNLRIQKFNQNLKKFMNSFKIEQTSLNYEINKYGISNTWSKISYEQSQYSQFFILRNRNMVKPDLRYSPFIIEIISYFDHKLASQIMNSIIQYFQDSIFYADQTFTDIIYPEHSEIFTFFKNKKNLKIINCLVFITLFRHINTNIGKQVNYSANKQIHDLIKIMLQINWKSHHKEQNSISVYEESFLDDLFTNSQNENPDMSVSKYAWLLKTIKILKKLNKSNQINELQLDSLEKTLRQYFKVQCVEKGKKVFRSINFVNDKRYYTRYISYETLLPFVYQLFSKYEEQYMHTLGAIQNLTTKYGIASSQNSPIINFNYKFRGNISPYFNYKILKMLQKQEPFDQEQIYLNFKNANLDPVQGIRAFIDLKKFLQELQAKLLDYNKNAIKSKIYEDWKSHHKLFGRWSPQGQPSQSESELILINCLFLAI